MLGAEFWFSAHCQRKQDTCDFWISYSAQFWNSARHSFPKRSVAFLWRHLIKSYWLICASFPRGGFWKHTSASNNWSDKTTKKPTDLFGKLQYQVFQKCALFCCGFSNQKLGSLKHTQEIWMENGYTMSDFVGVKQINVWPALFQD